MDRNGIPEEPFEEFEHGQPSEGASPPVDRAGGEAPDLPPPAPQPAGGVAAERKKSAGRRAAAIVTAVACALLMFGAGWLGCYLARDIRQRDFEWMMGILESQHYREVDMDAVYSSVYDAAMPDIYSAFYTKEEYQAMLEESLGHNRGIGVVMTQSQGHTVLYSVVGNSPAERAGLSGGMYILGYAAIGGQTQTGGVDAVSEFIAAQEGPFVLYASYDASAAADSGTAYELERGDYLAAYCTYRDSSGSYAYRGESELTLAQTGEGLSGLDERTAYIRLDGFDGNCAAEFAGCLALMKERRRPDLILDLRGNGGGYLSDLQSIASHLLKEAEGETPLVAYAGFRNGSVRNYYAVGNDYDAYFREDSRIVVLADENSASASEALIGAMIDYGTIAYGDVYVRAQEDGAGGTYGKGVMQSTFVAPSGGALQLTVARIYWPKGNCIHDRGIGTADGATAIEAPLLPGETDEFLQRAIARFYA